MKKIILLLALILVNFLALASAYADTSQKPSPMFEVEYKKVNRKEALSKFFEKYNSPLKENVDTFIEEADKFGIDYRIIPSISCMESTCGKFLIKNSYNPFGW